MRHLVIGQHQKAPNFSAFHWSSHGCLITIGQHFVTTRVVHLPKRTETCLITESDQSRANHQVLQLYTVRTACPIRTRLCGPCIAAKAGFLNKITQKLTSNRLLMLPQFNIFLHTDSFDLSKLVFHVKTCMLFYTTKNTVNNLPPCQTETVLSRYTEKGN